MTVANYCAFYVAEPFSEHGFGAHGTKDFVYYNLLRSWKGADKTFPFDDAHATTYSVRDNSDWEKTLKPRLRERLRNSKNIILFLSARTINSRALKEEIDYGANELGLPIIVIYPDYDIKEKLLNEKGALKQEIRNLWDNLPALRDVLDKVVSLHVPMNQKLIRLSLNDPELMLGSNSNRRTLIYPL